MRRQKPAPIAVGSHSRRREQLTVDQVLDLPIAGVQELLLLGPVRALSLELVLEEVLAILQLLDLRLVPLRLGRQLLGQALALLSRLAALQLLGTKLGFGLAQALLQCRGRFYKDKKKKTSTSTRK